MTTLKTYRAPSMAQALAAVKKDLGKDAVIVNTRSLKAGGWIGIGAKSIVEITASTPAPVPAPAAARAPVAVKTPNPAPIRERKIERQKEETRPASGAKGTPIFGGSRAAATEFEPAVLPGATAAVKSSTKASVAAPPVPRSSESISKVVTEEAGWTPADFASSIVVPKRAVPTPQAAPALAKFKPLETVEPSAPQAVVSVPPTPVPASPPVKSEDVETTIEPKMLISATDAAREAAAQSTAIQPSQSQPDPVATATLASAEATLARTEFKPIPAASLAVRAPMVPATPEARSVLEDELASMKRLMGQVLQFSRRAALVRESSLGVAGPAAPGGAASAGRSDPFISASGTSAAIQDGYVALLDAGVSPDMADEIVAGVRVELQTMEGENEAIVRRALLRRLAGQIAVAGPPAAPALQPDGRPLTIALIGPTGVGKTTTVAKLAAQYKLRQGRRVGLLTTDTYRIAAVEQLRTYAKIIGIPLKVATTPDEVERAMVELAGCEVVVMDTPGRSPADDARLGELTAAVRAASPHQTHLVMAATAGEPALLRIAERFGGLAPDHLILTKLDEAVQLGTVVAVAARARLPLSYVTDGQEVPDDIKVADAEQLAGRTMSGWAMSIAPAEVAAGS